MLTIKQTLFLIFGITSFVIFYVGFLNFLTLDTDVNVNEEINLFEKKEIMQKIIFLDEINVQLFYNYIISQNPTIKNEFINNHEVIGSLFKQLSSLNLNSYEMDVLNESQLIHNEIKIFENKIIQNTESDNTPIFSVLDEFQYNQKKDMFLSLTNSFLNHNQKLLHDLNEKNIQAELAFEEHGKRILVFAVIVSIGVGIGTLFISKKITTPIEKLEKSIRDFTKNPIQIDTELKSNFSELENLNNDFKKMTKTIENTLNLEKKLNIELQEIDREKDEFSAMISHELKTPLFPIKGYAQILLKEKLAGRLNALQSEAVNEIYESAKRLDKLIGDILAAQKLEMKKMTLSKSDVTVKELISMQIQNLSPLANEKQVNLKIGSLNNVILNTDKDRINEIFTNLITNAIDFVPKNKGIIEIGAYDSDEQIIFYVKDNGDGIPQYKLKNLFKKFYQIDSSPKRKHDGSGLGLAICKGLIENLGGKIWVESKEGKGTCFYFTLKKSSIITKQNRIYR